MYNLLNFISHIPKNLGQTDIFSQCEGWIFIPSDLPCSHRASPGSPGQVMNLSRAQQESISAGFATNFQLPQLGQGDGGPGTGTGWDWCQNLCMGIYIYTYIYIYIYILHIYIYITYIYIYVSMIDMPWLIWYLGTFKIPWLLISINKRICMDMQHANTQDMSNTYLKITQHPRQRNNQATTESTTDSSNHSPPSTGRGWVQLVYTLWLLYMTKWNMAWRYRWLEWWCTL